MVVLTVGRQAAKLNNKSTAKHFVLIGVSSIQGMHDYMKMYGEQATVHSTILQKASQLKSVKFGKGFLCALLAVLNSVLREFYVVPTNFIPNKMPASLQRRDGSLT